MPEPDCENYLWKNNYALHPHVTQIAQEYKTLLLELYGSDLADLIVYGSYARGDQHHESDVDFAVVLRRPNIRTSAEIARIAPISSQL